MKASLVSLILVFLLTACGEPEYYALPKETFLAFGPHGNYKVWLADSLQPERAFFASVNSVKGLPSDQKFGNGSYSDQMDVHYQMVDTLGIDSNNTAIVGGWEISMDIQAKYVGHNEGEIQFSISYTTLLDTENPALGSITFSAYAWKSTTEVLKRYRLPNGLYVNSMETNIKQDDALIGIHENLILDKIVFVEGMGLV